MTDDTLDIADRIAMIVGGGLILLAIPVIGFFTTIAGSMSPLYKYQVTKGGEEVVKYGLEKNIPEGATILADPLVDPMTRAWIVFLGLVVFALYAVYRVAVDRKTAGADTTARSRAGAEAD